MIDIQERLNEALRQYRHNNSDEFVFIRLLDKIDCALEKLTEADQNDNSTR